MKHISKFDSSRKTVGAISNELRTKQPEHIEIGDMGRELLKSLVDDINDYSQSNPFGGRPFYITVVEKKDSQLRNAIHRSIVGTLYRPYPENNTAVFHVEPSSNRVKLCWTLLHRTEMPNAINNDEQWSPVILKDCWAWMMEDLKYFGFSKDKDGKPFDTGIYPNDMVLGRVELQVSTR